MLEQIHLSLSLRLKNRIASQINESLKFHFIFKQSMKVQMMLHKCFGSIVACDVGQEREGVGPPCLEA